MRSLADNEPDDGPLRGVNLRDFDVFENPNMLASQEDAPVTQPGLKLGDEQPVAETGDPNGSVSVDDT